MIDLFHGTTPKEAARLFACNIDVNFGGGEFGKGFYLGTSKRLAKRRAFHKTAAVLGSAQSAMNSKNNTLKITFDSTNLSYFYKKKEVGRLEAKDIFYNLKKQKTTSTYSFSPYDYIVGPIAGRKGRYFCITQYKFDSLRSQNVLNKQCSNVSIITKII